MSLHLPRPSASSSSSGPATPTAPAAPSSADDVVMSPPSTTTRLPPRNFAPASSSNGAQPNHAAARAAARDLRAATKSPFVPKKKAAGAFGAHGGSAGGGGNGKERDLTGLSVEDLEEMLLRNKSVLDSPATLALLPGGSTKLLASQARISARLHELKEVQKLRTDMERTHLDDGDTDAGNGAVENGTEEVKMEDVDSSDHLSEATSPSAKRRLASRPSASSPNSLTSSISLSESIALQQADVARAREAARIRNEKAAAIERSTGSRLKSAMGGSIMESFMLHPDSEDSDSDVDLSFLSSSKISIPSTTEPTDTADYGIAGILDEEEDSQLNPYRVAYESGWQRANDEMANEVKAMERRP